MFVLFLFFDTGHNADNCDTDVSELESSDEVIDLRYLVTDDDKAGELELKLQSISGELNAFKNDTKLKLKKSANAFHAFSVYERAQAVITMVIRFVKFPAEGLIKASMFASRAAGRGVWHGRQIRRWYRQFTETGDIQSSKTGTAPSHSLINDEDFKGLLYFTSISGATPRQLKVSK
jgi:hypothetical protein